MTDPRRSPWKLYGGLIVGSVTADPEKPSFAVKNGAGKLLGEILTMMAIFCP